MLLDRYELLPLDIKGGFSVVSKALDRQSANSDMVAIKYLNSQGDSRLDFDLFEIEHRALKKLNHPNATKLLNKGFDSVAGKYFIVTPWLTETLRDRLDRAAGPANEDQFLRLSKYMIRGVEHAHSMGITHRDLKPENIMFSSSSEDDLNAVLIDFGISKSNQELKTSSAGTVVGFRTPLYAPTDYEVCADPIRDIYALGIIFFQLASRKTFVNRTDVLNFVNSSISQQALIRSSLIPVLERAIGEEQSQRFGSVVEFRQALDEALQGPEANRKKRLLVAKLKKSAIRDLETLGQYSSNAISYLNEHLSGQMLVIKKTVQSDPSALKFDLFAGGLKLFCIAPNDKPGGEISVLNVEISKTPANLQLAKNVSSKFAFKVIGENDYSSPTQLVDFLDMISPELVDQKLLERTSLLGTWLRVLDAREDLLLNAGSPISFSASHVSGANIEITPEAQESEAPIGSAWSLSSNPREFLEVTQSTTSRIFLRSVRPMTNFPKEGTLIPALGSNGSSLQKQKDALIELEEQLLGSENSIASVIENPSIASSARTPVSVSDFYNQKLDATKKDAISTVLNSEQISVISGPPGTGKTEFIAELVQQFLKINGPESKILLVSQTHVAVDNALQRLERAGLTKLIRVGRNEKVHETVRHLTASEIMESWVENIARSSKSAFFVWASNNNFSEVEVSLALEFALLAETLGVFQQKQESKKGKGAEKILATIYREELEAEEAAPSIPDKELRQIKTELTADLKALLPGDIQFDKIVFEDLAEALTIYKSRPDNLMLFENASAHLHWIKNARWDDDLRRRKIQESRVVAGTCIGFLSERHIKSLEFDLCIIDEASKATPTESIVPMMRASKSVLVGDERQLPPNDEELSAANEILEKFDLFPRDIEMNLFNWLSEHLPDSNRGSLGIQYRMVPEIGNLISKTFYDSELETGIGDIAPEARAVLGPAVAWISTENVDSHDEVKSQSGSFINLLEVDVIKKQLLHLERQAQHSSIQKLTEMQPFGVLIISAYSAQVKGIRDAVQKMSLPNLDVRVETLDSVQGLQSDYVIYSVTRSNPNKQLGFIGEKYWRRINVALSRSKYGLRLVGNFAFCVESPGALQRVANHIQNEISPNRIVRISS